MSKASDSPESVILQHNAKSQESVFGFSSAGLADVRESVERIHLALIFGWQDIAQRYRRSKVGVFWLTINMGVLISALGFLFSMLFRAPLDEFLPHLAAGIILFSFLSGIINESCTTFVSYQGIILQVRMPLFTHLLRLTYRNTVVFLHNLIILPIVLIALGKGISWTVLLAVPGFVLITLNVLWMGLILSIICTRYRDLTQIVANVLQVTFYITPIMWTPAILPPDSPEIILFGNPFYHMLELVRAPALGQVPSVLSWGLVTGMVVVGWTVAILFFGRFRHRIPYWL